MELDSIQEEMKQHIHQGEHFYHIFQQLSHLNLPHSLVIFLDLWKNRQEIFKEYQQAKSEIDNTRESMKNQLNFSDAITEDSHESDDK